MDWSNGEDKPNLRLATNGTYLKGYQNTMNIYIRSI